MRDHRSRPLAGRFTHLASTLRGDRHRGAGRRRVVAILLFAAIVPSVTACDETTAADRQAVIDLINSTRRSNGHSNLTADPMLNHKADGWAKYLRDNCTLKHSRLSDGAPPQWVKLGENVGYGGSIKAVHDAYLKSSSHKANIVDSSFSRVGAAAVWGTCDGQRRVFTVQVFMQE